MTNNTTLSASNADALKMLGRAAIMRTAWRFVKVLRVASLSEALKKAWAECRRKVDVDREAKAYAKAAKARTDAAVAKREAAKAAYTGDKKTRSPLNPHYDFHGRLSGVMGGAYTSTIVGR